MWKVFRLLHMRRSAWWKSCRRRRICCSMSAGKTAWRAERRKIRGCRCSTAVSGVCRSVPSSAGECGTRRSTEKLYVFDLPDGKGTGGRNVYIICCLSGNRYNKCGCAAVPQYGRGKRRDCDSSDRTCMDGYKVTCEIRKPQEVTAGNPNSSPPM